MTAYAGHRVEDHEDFILGILLPGIVGHARASGTPTEVVVMACWMSLSTILQTKGLSRDTLMRAIDASRMDVHQAPEGLQ